MKILIIGGGQVGSYLASLLAKEHQVTIIEQRHTTYEKLIHTHNNLTILQGSGTDASLLEQADIAHTDILAAVTGLDEVNLVASTIAKMEYAVPRVIGRVNNPKNAWLYTPLMGIDIPINQSDIMAHLVANNMDFTTFAFE
ncbi:MAG: potassium channel family protein [Erysipelotrichaceae bacterium]